MEIQQAIKILRYHQKWRRGALIEMLDPKDIGEAIDVILGYFKKEEKKWKI